MKNGDSDQFHGVLEIAHCPRFFDNYLDLQERDFIRDLASRFGGEILNVWRPASPPVRSSTVSWRIPITADSAHKGLEFRTPRRCCPGYSICKSSSRRCKH